MRRCLLVCLALLILTPSVKAEEGYISLDELEDEIARRREDIARTDYRISAVTTEENSALTELGNARADGAVVEQQAIVRARVLYRISRNGGSLRYLLGADSPVNLLKRLSDLKRLLVHGLEARRQAGHRIVAAERRVSNLRDEKDAAFQMKGMLADALSDLEEEKARLSGK